MTRRLTRAAALAALLAAPLACNNGVTDTLLEAVDPDLIAPSNLRSAEGAQAAYVGTFYRFNAALAGQNADTVGSFLWGGLLADEWSTSSTYVQNDETDARSIQLDNTVLTRNFRALARVRTSTNQAIALLREFRPTETVKVAEMYLQRGFAELQLASDYCNGIPLSDAAGDAPVFGAPTPVAEVFAVAIASFDSALALAGGTDAAAQRINRAARVAKARALLGLNRVADAAALVSATAVPTSFSYNMSFSLASQANNIWGQGVSNRRFTVGDSVEGNARNLLVRNAIPFFSARDPRVPVAYTVSANQRDTTKGQDGSIYSRTTAIYDRFTDVPVANGLDARLIEAEARLAANDVPGMLAILNALRAAPPQLGTITPAALPALATPASRDAALDLLFREKAFWTFSRGQRLGDLRRLVRFYGRTPETTFPVGQFYRGGQYGADVNLPIPTDELVNPNFTGCIDRRA
ncbi:hypothetical protein [Roseisolibacter sp. H3M3-2]|uniref:hypothetical protein n=1 Tax=Roseisolibacter sp. H3M3-2 TaxID=3031323 RepID=UPI0023D994C3|nr:hypothetical protein [Roseisolibacter sp. H3M3-2]MDF1503750.1 hypothetical protein [Roseisolibacter sp. H3M3-2]